MTRPVECEWGEYLLTFDQDHLEMVGFNADFFPVSIYNLVADNIRLTEILKDKEEAKLYGVDSILSS